MGRRTRSELLDDVPERSCGVSHFDVAGHDRHDLRRFAEQLSGCEMHRIECAERFDGKGTADASEHRAVNVQYVTAPFEGSQGSNSCLFLCWGQPASCARPDDRAASLGEGEGRRHQLRASRQRLQGCGVVLQQRGYERTRLHVPNVRRDSRRPAGTPGGRPSRASARDVTLRHDRCRSIQRRCRAAAGCLASPRTGHRLPREGGECRPR
jgi:hypothetical protein